MMSLFRRAWVRRAALGSLLALATAVPGLAAAQVPEVPAPEVHAPEVQAPEKDRPEPKSVYEINPWIDYPIILGTNLATAGIYWGVTATPTCPCDPLTVNAFDRHAIGNHSDVADLTATTLVLGSAIIPLGLDLAILGPNRVALEDTTVFAEALSVSGALVSIVKATYNRPFPRTYAGSKIDDPTNYRSFYSGHTALTFTALSAAAVTIGRRYHVHAVPWVATATVGSAVAILMVWSGWHFPSDVIVGAVAGTAVGVAVPTLHFREVPVRPVVTKATGGAPLVGLAITY